MKFTFFFFFCLPALTAISQKNENTDFHLDKNYAIGPNGLLSLTCSDAKVTITGSARKDAHVQIDREVHTRGLVFGDEEFAVNIEEKSGDLEIKERSGSTSVGIVGYHYEKYTIHIEVPAGVNLRVRGDDGDYLITSVNGTIEMNLDDADVELKTCKGSAFTFTLDDGDIKMDEGKGILEVDADDGDVVIQHGAFSKIQADVDDGDFIVETMLVDNGDYFIESQDGFISLIILGGGGKFDILHDDTRVTTEGNFATVERAEDRTRLTLANGNAKVDIRADDARVKLVANY